MNPPSGDPATYRVIYSELARSALKHLADQARRKGITAQFISALKKIDRLLRIYPQFGEPIIDLKLSSGQVFVGCVSPVVVRYAIFEDRRLVIVANPFELLS